jgi:hypothetical protein
VLSTNVEYQQTNVVTLQPYTTATGGIRLPPGTIATGGIRLPPGTIATGGMRLPPGTIATGGMRLPPGTDATGAVGFPPEVHAASRMVLPKTVMPATTTRSSAVTTHFTLRASFFTLDLLFCYFKEVPTPSFTALYGRNKGPKTTALSRVLVSHRTPPFGGSLKLGNVSFKVTEQTARAALSGPN